MRRLNLQVLLIIESCFHYVISLDRVCVVNKICDTHINMYLSYRILHECGMEKRTKINFLQGKVSSTVWEYQLIVVKRHHLRL
jgi:hypothetical protein